MYADLSPQDVQVILASERLADALLTFPDPIGSWEAPTTWPAALQAATQPILAAWVVPALNTDDRTTPDIAFLGSQFMLGIYNRGMEPMVDSDQRRQDIGFWLLLHRYIVQDTYAGTYHLTRGAMSAKPNYRTSDIGAALEELDAVVARLHNAADAYGVLEDELLDSVSDD